MFPFLLSLIQPGVAQELAISSVLDVDETSSQQLCTIDDLYDLRDEVEDAALFMEEEIGVCVDEYAAELDALLVRYEALEARYEALGIDTTNAHTKGKAVLGWVTDAHGKLQDIADGYLIGHESGASFNVPRLYIRLTEKYPEMLDEMIEAAGFDTGDVRVPCSEDLDHDIEEDVDLDSRLMTADNCIDYMGKNIGGVTSRLDEMERELEKLEREGQVTGEPTEETGQMIDNEVAPNVSIPRPHIEAPTLEFDKSREEKGCNQGLALAAGITALAVAGLARRRESTQDQNGQSR